MYPNGRNIVKKLLCFKLEILVLKTCTSFSKNTYMFLGRVGRGDLDCIL